MPDYELQHPLFTSSQAPFLGYQLSPPLISCHLSTVCSQVKTENYSSIDRIFCPSTSHFDHFVANFNLSLMFRVYGRFRSSQIITIRDILQSLRFLHPCNILPMSTNNTIVLVSCLFIMKKIYILNLERQLIITFIVN